MSWHLPHRLTTTHRAVSIALLYSISSAALPSIAHAATVGKTVVTSSQHEPLAASITVTDISNAADFSASLANPTVYQQMGLTPTASMSVRFVPSSATSGQVIINTTQPVSMPFADVVLTLNDQGKRNVVPKTLLMPLGKNVPVQQPRPVVAATPKPNLPVTSVPAAKPLAVKREAPPLLFNTPNLQAQNLPQTSASEQPLSAEQAANMPVMLANSASANSNINGSNNTDKQLDILNVEVTRQIQAANTKGTTDKPSQPLMLSKDAADSDAHSNVLLADSETNIDNTKANLEANKRTAAKQATAGVPAAAQPSTPKNNQSVATQKANNTATPTPNYTVQHNDNLWIISQQIAKQNNLDIQTVMTQIQNQNPDAFIKQDASLLKADAQLNLPNYKVVPSQQSLQTAIAAQKQQYLKTTKSATAEQQALQAQSEKAKQATSAKPESAQAAKRTKKPAVTTTQTLPQAQFSVIAPGRDGSADGTQTKAAAATGNGLSTDILATLQASRQRTAAQAIRLNATNNALGSFTQKLQLQNQKLAELEARLKKLRNQ